MAASKTSILGLVAVVVLAVAGYLTWSALDQDPPAPQAQVKLLDGQPFDTASLHGKVTLVNFWATSCTTCVGEMPEMVQTYDRFAPKGFQLLAVAMQYDPPDYVRNFAAQRKLPFTVAMDTTGSAAKAFHDVRLTPTSFLIDKSGRIVKQYVGPPNFAELHQLISQLLEGKNA